MSEIVFIKEAVVPPYVPNGSKGRRTKKIVQVRKSDDTFEYACVDCSYTANSFNSVAAHRRVHVTSSVMGLRGPEPKRPRSTIRGTHLEKVLLDEVMTAIDKAVFEDQRELGRLHKEVSSMKVQLKKEREARRKAERALKRIKSVI